MEFTIADKYECEERWPSSLAAEEVAPWLSELKSRAFPWPLEDDCVLITADTVVTVDGMVLGKPADRSEALRMLRLLSGRTHTVVTGVTLRTPERMKTFAEQTRVTFSALTDAELERYVDTCRPYDKAGAYGIQEWIGTVAAVRIEGSWQNVMGLPVQRLYGELKEF